MQIFSDKSAREKIRDRAEIGLAFQQGTYRRDICICVKVEGLIVRVHGLSEHGGDNKLHSNFTGRQQYNFPVW